MCKKTNLSSCTFPTCSSCKANDLPVSGKYVIKSANAFYTSMPIKLNWTSNIDEACRWETSEAPTRILDYWKTKKNTILYNRNPIVTEV